MSPQATNYLASCPSLSMALCQAQVDADNCRDWNAPIHAIKLELQREAARREEDANPGLAVKRLRAAAADKRKAYRTHMDDYGPEIGRATRRAANGEHVLAALAESAAAASLSLATECLKEAEALEHEADSLAPWVVLFDGVSAKAAAPFSISSIQKAA